MHDPRFNFLDDHLIEVSAASGAVKDLSLPEVLSALSTRADMEFTHLQAHQFHAWHAFLVQLAALALNATGASNPFEEPRAWCDALLQLTGGSVEPWCLVVPDLSKPALLQPPVPEGSVHSWVHTEFPDEVDLLVTSRNHDVKGRRIGHSTPDHWLLALVSVQTMDGYPGRDNYGIARMNGAYGNRPCVAVARDLRFSTRFQRDLSVIQHERAAAAATYGYSERAGCGLLWTVPWDGAGSLAISDLDPCFIEVCRRLRLTQDGAAIVARRIGTKVRRIDAEQHKGDLGDPWTPIRREDHAALSAKGLSYTTLQEILFDGGYKASPAAKSRAEDGDSPVVLALILARGKGRTDGLHERVIPVPPRARALFATAEGRQRLGLLARNRVDRTATARREVLRPALLTLVQGAPEKLNFKDDRVNSYTDHFDTLVDAVFFARLFADVDRDADAAERDFVGGLIGLARAVLEDAMESLPIPAAREYRALSRAEAKFWGASRRNFPQLKRGEEEGNESDGHTS